MALSADGSIVAAGGIGADGGVGVYQYSSGNKSWVQLGQGLIGEGVQDQFGAAVALSENGFTVAIGGPFNSLPSDDDLLEFSSQGHVRVFQFNATLGSWEQLGQDLDGEAPLDYFGTSVALSADGSIVAAGSAYNDGSISGAGHVRIFQFDCGNQTWVQLGDDLDGQDLFGRFGYSVSLSADGSIVATGSMGGDGTGRNAGHVSIFQYNNDTDTWQQLGQNIDGEAAFDLFGYSVSLSADGSFVAAGGFFNDGRGSDSGHVRIFQFNGTLWVQLGQDVDGEAAFDLFGSSVALSADGSIVAAGAAYNDDGGDRAGHVRVFEGAI